MLARTRLFVPRNSCLLFPGSSHTSTASCHGRSGIGEIRVAQRRAAGVPSLAFVCVITAPGRRIPRLLPFPSLRSLSLPLLSARTLRARTRARSALPMGGMSRGEKPRTTADKTAQRSAARRRPASRRAGAHGVPARGQGTGPKCRCRAAWRSVGIPMLGAGRRASAARPRLGPNVRSAGVRQYEAREGAGLSGEHGRGSVAESIAGRIAGSGRAAVQRSSGPAVAAHRQLARGHASQLRKQA